MAAVSRGSAVAALQRAFLPVVQSPKSKNKPCPLSSCGTSDHPNSSSLPVTPVSASPSSASFVSSLPSFSLLTYNVLASYSAKPQYFTNVKAEHLKHLHRWQAILAEIDLHGADVLCLQEVDQYREFWKPELEERGYQVLYTKRTGLKTDGELIAFRHSRFYLTDQRVITYNDLVALAPGDEASRAQFATDNTSLAAVLTPLPQLDKDHSPHGSAEVFIDAASSLPATSSSASISSSPSSPSSPSSASISSSPSSASSASSSSCPSSAPSSSSSSSAASSSSLCRSTPTLPSILVASVHLFWNPEYTHVRLAQTRYLLRTLSEMAEAQPEHVREHLAAVVAGDFNANFDSPPYRTVLNAHHRAGGFSLGRLRSAYASDDGRVDAPYSSFTHGKHARDRLVDYLFFSSERLHVTSRLGLPSFERVSAAYQSFPNESYGSDHLCLAAKFTPRWSSIHHPPM